jgi:hypothetical protein
VSVSKVKLQKPPHDPLGRPVGMGTARHQEPEDHRLIRRSGQTDLQNDEEDKAVAGMGTSSDHVYTATRESNRGTSSGTSSDHFHTVTRESNMDGDLVGPMADAIKRKNEYRDPASNLRPGVELEEDPAHDSQPRVVGYRDVGRDRNFGRGHDSGVPVNDYAHGYRPS